MSEPQKADGEGPKLGLSFSLRAERSLKDADRLLRENPDRAPEQRAMAELEQAKVWALLQLADDIRETQGA